MELKGTGLERTGGGSERRALHKTSVSKIRIWVCTGSNCRPPWGWTRQCRLPGRRKRSGQDRAGGRPFRPRISSSYIRRDGAWAWAGGSGDSSLRASLMEFLVCLFGDSRSYSEQLYCPPPTNLECAHLGVIGRGPGGLHSNDLKALNPEVLGNRLSFSQVWVSLCLAQLLGSDRMFRMGT